MNSIVNSWNRYQQRAKPNASDGLVIDDEHVLVLVENQNPKVKDMGHPDRKVGINFGAVHELALFGPQEQIETLYAETYRTVKRLRLRTKNAGILSESPRFKGGRPSNHDIIPWLNAIDKTEDKYSQDVQFLRQLHNTIRGRVHEDVLAKVEV